VVIGAGLGTHLLKSHNFIRKRWAFLLKHAAIGIVINMGNTVGSHNIIIKESAGSIYCEASTVGHTKSLRHFLISI
jgi:hypothetical protein